MRISEILFQNNEPSEENRPALQLDLPWDRSSDFLTNLATAFTRHGEVKRLWNPNRSEGQPSGPAPPDAGTELIPSGTLEPTKPSWQAEPAETKPQVGRHRLVRFRQYRGDQATDLAHFESQPSPVGWSQTVIR